MMVFYAVLSLLYKFSLVHVNNNFNNNIIQQEFFIV